MWQVLALYFLSFLAIAESDSCRVGTTGVQVVKDKEYDLTGQTYVVTGGDSGLGLGIATAVMQANARVVFLAHDLNKTHAAIRGIEKITGNRNYRIIPCDLLSLSSTKEAADTLKEETQINGLVGDAGSIMLKSFLTHDGFESEFQLEYLSHFYLVQRLLPKLRESHGRIVFTGSDGLSPYDKLAGLCSQSMEPQGCEALDKIAARVNRTVPGQIFANFNGNEFLAMYLRVMLARHISLVETNVTAFSFHPGWSDTPGTSGTFDKRAEQWFAMFGFAFVGFVLGCLGYAAGVVPLSKVPLAVLLGVGAGYVLAGDWVCVAYCSHVDYYQCLCNDPNGTSIGHCPLNYLEGSMGGAYLATAPSSALANNNGALSVLCGTQIPGLKFDPYVAMVNQTGETATRDYLQSLYNLSMQWIAEADYRNSKSRLTKATSHSDSIGSRPQPLTI